MISRVKGRFWREIEKRLHAHQRAVVIEQANAKSRKAYEQIVAARPEAALSFAEKKRIRSYAKEVLGSVHHAPGLFVYTAWRGEFREGWIPRSYFHSVLIPSWTPFHYFDRKTFTKRILADAPVPDLAYYIRGFWLDSSFRPIPREAVRGVLFDGREHVFVKRDASSRGQGVSKVSANDFNLQAIENQGDLVVQAPIRQHKWFNSFMPDAVATVRITTVKIPGRPAEARACYLRLPRAGLDIVKAGETIDVSLDERNGALWSKGIASWNWKQCDVHPDSGRAFEGEFIPRFDRLLEFCLTQHDSTPISGLIGWDVVLDQDEKPVLIEFNQGRAGINMIEANKGPCFLGLGWENIWRKTR